MFNRNSKEIIDSCLIGYGQWGKNIFKSIKNNNLLNIKYVCKKNINNIAWNDDNIRITNDYKEAIDSNVKLVFIATKANLHFEICKYALKNKKDIFIEKPICLNSLEHAELIYLAKKNKRILHVNYIYIYNQNFINAVEFYNKEEKGKDNLIKIQIGNNGPLRYETPVYFDWLTHIYAIIFYIFKTDKINFIKIKKISKKNINNKFNIYILLTINENTIKILTGNDFKNRNIKITFNKKIYFLDDYYKINNIKYKNNVLSPLENSIDNFVKKYQNRDLKFYKYFDKITNEIENIKKILN